MIDRLYLSNFKCFRYLELPFSNINLLTGVNGVGKSSVIQALLLLRQSYIERLLPQDGLLLNGSIIKMGTAGDVFCEFADEDVLDIDFEFRGMDFEYRFSYRDQYDDVLFLESDETPLALGDISLFNDHFQYIEAERLGPRKYYETSALEVKRHRRIGAKGEYAAHFLMEYGDEKIHSRGSSVSHPNALSESVLDQVNAWLQEFRPGVGLSVSFNPNTDTQSLLYSFSGRSDVSKPFKPTNVGFGLSYTLSVVTALVSAVPGDLIVIENPEAHLHPSGQARVGELAAAVANTGVQVLMETHSDHVLNGLRVAASKGQVSPAQVQIHFFAPVEGDSPTAVDVISPTIDDKGRLDVWPVGFFDTYKEYLDKLL